MPVGPTEACRDDSRPVGPGRSRLNRTLGPNLGSSYYRARYYDPATGRFISEDRLAFGGNGTDFYLYAGNDPVGIDDPSGCGFIDCLKALAELDDALFDLAKREAENVAAGKCDSGHDKAIRQAKNRVLNALAKARKCLPKEKIKEILDMLKKWGEDLGDEIWNWLNRDPRQNWPWIYGPMPGVPPVPVPVP